MSRSVRVVVVLVLLGTLGQAVSLVSRGRRGDSDFGVFHRTTQLLASGMGGELYPRLDVVTNWPISLSPTGLAIFQPLAGLSPVMASAVWAVANLVLLGVSIVALRNLVTRKGDARSNEFFAWATVTLLVLSSGSIQVGQFSVLFVACWILSLSALAAGRDFRAGLLLAVPGAIKLYPVMMLAIPLSFVRDAREGSRQILQFVFALLITCLAVPLAMYGARGWALNLSFWRHVILSPDGQVEYMQTVRHSNQSLDTLLLRYFAYEPDFHDLFVNVPHLSWDKGDVLAVANIARLFIVLATVAAVWQWRRTPRTLTSHDDLLTMAGLWSSTLYLMLPETKARYAVYAFLGFLPILKRAAASSRETTRAARVRLWVEVAGLIMLILVTLPDAVQVYGVGFLGAALLWAANIRHAWLARYGVEVKTVPAVNRR
jgi:Glycosyltransferase family 87